MLWIKISGIIQKQKTLKKGQCSIRCPWNIIMDAVIRILKHPGMMDINNLDLT